jgi:hypothetical protein
MRSFRWLAAGVVAAGVSVGAAAQNGEAVCSLGNSAGVNYGAGYGSKIPFSLTAKSSFEQQLADGSYVRGYSLTTLARDGKGRTMSEFVQRCYRKQDGQLAEQYSVNIWDPVTKTSLMWEVYPGSDKVARETSSDDRFERPRLTAAELEERRKEMREMEPPASETKTETLGERTIAGVEAKGTRTTRTIPAGAEGNELMLKTTQEMWVSKELGLTMLAITDDPRTGRRTYEVQGLTQGEPDASIFTPPAGYRVEYRKTVVEESKPEAAVSGEAAGIR